MHNGSPSVPSGSRYPGYDVLSKWHGPSWNEKTREVVARRIAIGPDPLFFSAHEFITVNEIAARIVPQPPTRPPIPVAMLVDHKLHWGMTDGYRLAGMPREGEAWRQGVRALDAEARAAYGASFAELSETKQNALLQRAEAGALKAMEWGSMRSKDFFKYRLLHDIVLAYYAHPTAWSEIGWGGPASPRGYVRMDFNERDPWEAAEAKSDQDASAVRINRSVR